MKCDISKYFYSIQHEPLKQMTRKYIKDPDILWLVDLIVDSTENPGIPIGNQTSQWFAVMYLSGMDHFIKEKLGIRYYGRYMDDFYLIHEDKAYLQYCRGEIEQYVARLGLRMNKKTNIFPGGFSEKVFVSEEHLKNVAYLVPENMTDEEISFYEPLGCCIRAIKRCALQKDDTALIVGLGSIGLLMGEGLKAMGYKVYGCDLIPERIELAKKMGIEPFDFSFEVDGVFMTSGADKAIDTALKAVRAGGKILVFSSTPLSNGYPNNEIYYKELTVLGSYSPSPADLKDSFDLLASGKVNVKGLTTVYPLDKIQQAFDDTVANKIFKAYIKIAG